MRTPIAILPLVLPLLLAACGPNPADPGPGGVTAGEAKALDDAAAMLDRRRPQPATSPAPTPSQEAPQ